MALGVANGQTVIPVNTANNHVLLAMPQGGATINGSPACNNIKPAPTQILPMMTMTQPTLAPAPSPTVVVTTPAAQPPPLQPIKIQCASVPASPVPQQDAGVSNIARQQLMEQLASTVTKNGSTQDSDINDELIEFMRCAIKSC